MLSVGIDIGRFSIKMAEVTVTSKGYELVRTHEFPLNQDPTRDQRLELIDALRSISSQYDPESTRYVLGVPQSRVAVRRLEFPFRERHKVIKSIGFELEDSIPFSQETAIYDARITHHIGPRSEVLALACPKEVIQEFLQTAHDGSMEMELLSTQGIALANLFEDPLAGPVEEPDQNQPIPESSPADIIIDIGHQTTTVLVVKQGQTLDLRTIDWGGKNLAEAISKKYKMHYVEALKELQKKAFLIIDETDTTKDQQTFSNLLKKQVDELGHQLNLCLLNLQSDLNLHFRSVSTLGGVSQLRGLGPYLTQRLEIPVNRIQRLAHHPQLDFVTNSYKETTCGIAIGLAVEGARKAKAPAINFLKDEFIRKSQSMEFFWEKWGHTLKVAGAGFLLFLVYAVARDTMTSSMNDVAYDQMVTQAKNIAGLKRGKANARNARKYIKEQKKLAKSMEMAKSISKVNSSLDVISNLTQSLPSSNMLQLNIFRLSIDNDSLLIEGETPKSASVGTIKKSLQGLSRNGKVSSLKTQFTASKGWTPFAFRILMDRKAGG